MPRQTVREAIAFLQRQPAYYTVDTVVVHVESRPRKQPDTRQLELPMVHIWASPYGDIRLPADFPTFIFRKDGWWDGRFKALREKWEAWMTEEEKKLIDQQERWTK